MKKEAEPSAMPGNTGMNKVPPVVRTAPKAADASPPQKKQKEQQPGRAMHTAYEKKKPSAEEQELNALVHELKDTMNKPLASPEAYVSLKKKLMHLRNFLQEHPDLCRELNQRQERDVSDTATAGPEHVLEADLRQMEKEARIPAREAALLSPQGQQERTAWLHLLLREMQSMEDPGKHAGEWKAMKAAAAYAEEVNEAVGRELQNGKDPDGKPRVRFEYLQKLDAAMEAVHLTAKVYKRSLERSLKAHHKVNPARLRLADHLESNSIGVLKRTRTVVRRAVRNDVRSLLDRNAMKKQFSEVSAVLSAFSTADHFAKTGSAAYEEMITSLQKLQNMQKKLEQKNTSLSRTVPVSAVEFNACYGEKGTAAQALAAVNRYIRKNEMKENPGRASAVRLASALRMRRYLQTLKTLAVQKTYEQLQKEEPEPPVRKAPAIEIPHRNIPVLPM